MTVSQDAASSQVTPATVSHRSSTSTHDQSHPQIRRLAVARGERAASGTLGQVLQPLRGGAHVERLGAVDDGQDEAALRQRGGDSDVAVVEQLEEAVTFALAGLARSDMVATARSTFGPSRMVERASPFQCIVASGPKFSP
jgi:hypothetical protein